MQISESTKFRFDSRQGGIMNRFFSSKVSFSKAGNCRNLSTSSRRRRDRSAERLEEEWRELRRHVTIENDPEKMLQLAAELAQRRRQTPALDKGSDSF